MSHFSTSKSPGRSRFCYLYLFLLMPLLACIVYAERPVEHESAQAYEFARRLIQQDRFQEAEAYLNNELQFLPLTRDRLPFLMLLIDVNLETADRDQAIDAINEAYRWAESERDSARINKLRREAMYVRQRAEIISKHASASANTDTVTNKQYDGPLVTNSFFETDLGIVLSDLSLVSGVPILWGPDVQGNVTYDAIDEPLDKVLESILLPLGYTHRLHESKFVVGSILPDSPTFPILAETDVVELNNIPSAEALRALTPLFQEYARATQTGNSVMITAPRSIIRRIRSDLQVLDESPEQISIEVIVTEITHEGRLNLGVDWAVENQSEAYSRMFSTDHPEIDNPSSMLEIMQPGAEIAGEVVNVRASLEALLSTGDAQIRANPRITTQNGRMANIRLVRDEYFIINTGTGYGGYQQNSLEAISSGIQLEITPFISDDHTEITMQLKPVVGDVVGQEGNGLPKINTRSAETTVRVKNGETFTIGGLNLEYNQEDQRKIPLLGSIPLLGYLFRYTHEYKRKSEIVIFVTPHYVEE